MPPSISVLGAGSWGTALAILAARNGCQTTLWGHNPEHIASLRLQRVNQRYLPGIALPENLRLTDDLRQAVEVSEQLLISVPSHAFKPTLLKLQPLLDGGAKVAWATKGFDQERGDLLSVVAAEILGAGVTTAILSGPTFAKEVAEGLPTAVTIASNSEQFAAELARIFHNPRFRAYTSNDIIGVQVGGACKNVLAIAAGIADGLGFGANTRAALITRGLNEIMRLGLKLGGQPDTFMGLTGLGDLILTCTDNQSRNRRFGLALGQGDDHQQALKAIDQSVEGIFAAREAYLLSQRHRIEMPITEQVYKVLFEAVDPKLSVQNLLNRDPKAEI